MKLTWCPLLGCFQIATVYKLTDVAKQVSLSMPINQFHSDQAADPLPHVLHTRVLSD